MTKRTNLGIYARVEFPTAALERAIMGDLMKGFREAAEKGHGSAPGWTPGDVHPGAVVTPFSHSRPDDSDGPEAAGDI
jgi:hypothetical protein